MYINRIRIQNFRTFRDTEVDFIHLDQDFAKLGIPRPKAPNVNLLLGNNGAGKTTMLKAIAIAALGPAVTAANLPAYHLIRRANGEISDPPVEATIKAAFDSHTQDEDPPRHGVLESRATIKRIGDVELPDWSHFDPKPWHPIYSNAGDAFFFVGYGATRRVENKDTVDPGARQANSFVRA